MRPIETLSLLANLLAFLVLAVPPPRALRWMRHAALVALPLASAQMLIEGPRWQMIPAYVLAALFAGVWLRQHVAPPRLPATRQRWHGLVVRASIVLGALAVAVSAVLPTVFPVFRFPHPGGPHAIGTLTYHWTDATRPETLTAESKRRRELMVQIWYPAKADPFALRAPYLADADTVMSAFARIHHRPEFIFGHFRHVTTNAIPSAPAAGDQARYPVLLFLEGVTGFRQMNTFQVEELVSHGYIVAAIDQPGAAAAVVFPDGRKAAGLTVEQAQAAVRPSYMPDAGAPSLIRAVSSPNSVIAYLAQDAIFTLDQLAALNQVDPNGILTGKLDLRRAGAFGVSLGGIVVGEACRLDPRLRACLVMDAPMSTAVVKAGLQQPSMWITRDAHSMRLERQRAGGWPQAEIEAHQTTMRAVYQSLPGAGYFVRVPGMFHSNFMDIANWLALGSQLGLTGPINAQRAHAIVNAYSVAFFDRHLRGQPATLLDGPAVQYPEVLFESRRP